MSGEFFSEMAKVFRILSTLTIQRLSETTSDRSERSYRRLTLPFQDDSPLNSSFDGASNYVTAYAGDVTNGTKMLLDECTFRNPAASS